MLNTVARAKHYNISRRRTSPTEDSDTTEAAAVQTDHELTAQSNGQTLHKPITIFFFIIDNN